MPRPSNFERDAEILSKIEAGWTYKKLAKFYNMAYSSLFEAKERAEKRKFRLSTDESVKALA